MLIENYKLVNKIKNTAIANLKKMTAIFNEDSADKKKELLTECANLKLSAKKTIDQYHDCLIFLSASVNFFGAGNFLLMISFSSKRFSKPFA